MRNLNVIAAEILADFRREYHENVLKYNENVLKYNENVITKKPKKPISWQEKYVYALAYVEPMLSLSTINDDYGWDSGRSIVAYALGNLTTWKGEKAKAIKKELNDMLKK